MVEGKYSDRYVPVPYSGTTTPIRQTQKIRFVILGHVEGAERLILGHYLFNVCKKPREGALWWLYYCCVVSVDSYLQTLNIHIQLNRYFV